MGDPCDEHETAKKEKHCANGAPEFRAETCNLAAVALQPVRHVIEQILPRRVTLLGSHGGIGKSVLALVIGAHVACGRAFCGLPTIAGRVLYVSFEDDIAVVRYRLKKIADAYGLSLENVERNIAIIDASELDAPLAVERMRFGVRVVEMTPAFEALVTLAAEGFDLVIIDNASDAYDGDEIQRRQVRRFVRALTQRIARPYSCAVLLLCHVDKLAARFGSSGNTYSGSTAWHNSVRSRLALTATNDTIELVHEKSNYSALAETIVLRWEGVVLVPSSAERQREAAKAQAEQQAKRDADEILRVIEIAVAARIDVPTAATGPNTTAAVLARLPELADEYRDKNGRERINAAVVQLLRDGRIVEESYRTGHRNERIRLVPVGSPQTGPSDA